MAEKPTLSQADNTELRTCIYADVKTCRTIVGKKSITEKQGYAWIWLNLLAMSNEKIGKY